MMIALGGIIRFVISQAFPIVGTEHDRREWEYWQLRDEAVSRHVSRPWV